MTLEHETKIRNCNCGSRPIVNYRSCLGGNFYLYCSSCGLVAFSSMVRETAIRNWNKLTFQRSFWFWLVIAYRYATKLIGKALSVRNNTHE